jgi:hypothetical protein
MNHVQLLVRRREVHGRSRAVVLRPKVRIRLHDHLQLFGITKTHGGVKRKGLKFRLRRVPPGGRHVPNAHSRAFARHDDETVRFRETKTNTNTRTMDESFSRCMFFSIDAVPSVALSRVARLERDVSRVGNENARENAREGARCVTPSLES